MPKPNSVIIYEGPSMLDGGGNIVAIATGLKKASANRKTGAMVQIWVEGADASPVELIKSGGDSVVCGGCPHRGKACYVNAGYAPQSTWKAYKRGSHTVWDGTPFDKPVRLGAYGDPAAVPVEVWQKVLDAAPKGWTGYTHQWKEAHAAPLKGICMASCDTPEEAVEATAKGWRVFRVKPENAPLYEGEIQCPNTTNAIQCADCGLCNGARDGDGRKSIAIDAHGPSASLAKVGA